jgi:hypothetical protein
VVEFRNNISERTSVVAKRDTTIHASGSLLIELFVAIALYEFVIIFQPVFYRKFGR